MSASPRWESTILGSATYTPCCCRTLIPITSGDQKMKTLGAGSCEKVELVPAGAHSVTAEIAAAKNAVVVMVVDLSVIIGKKIEGLTGTPTPACPQEGGAATVPVAAPCRSNIH